MEGELREIQDLLSMFTQPHQPQDVGVARSSESSQDKPCQASEESPNVSTMLPQKSKQSKPSGNSISIPVPMSSGTLVAGVVEESSLDGSGGTQTNLDVARATVGVSGTSGVHKDVEFDSVLSELQCIEGEFIVYAHTSCSDALCSTAPF